MIISNNSCRTLIRRYLNNFVWVSCGEVKKMLNCFCDKNDSGEYFEEFTVATVLHQMKMKGELVYEFRDPSPYGLRKRKGRILVYKLPQL